MSPDHWRVVGFVVGLWQLWTDKDPREKAELAKYALSDRFFDTTIERDDEPLTRLRGKQTWSKYGAGMV